MEGQIGLEAHYSGYVETMVSVFREIRRVLREDGTVWLNLGDSYSASGKGGNPEGSEWGGFMENKGRETAAMTNRTFGRPKPPEGLKPKDLVGIPWRVAFALQADGWYLRQDIIWSKPNSMPESVRDRCTKAHEYLFLLSKSQRYYYDAEAIAEPNAEVDRPQSESRRQQRMSRIVAPVNGGGQSSKAAAGEPTHMMQTGATRNKRSVWEVATQPFPEAHFATFPPALIEPCILAGCPKGGTVLDPFGGAGTTGLVADRLGRSAVLIELNPEYAAMAERRIRNDAGMFADVQNTMELL